MRGLLIMNKSEIARNLTVISNRLGLIGNFIESVQYDSAKKDDYAVMYVLFNRGGLDNLTNSLDDIREQVQMLSDNLVDIDEGV